MLAFALVFDRVQVQGGEAEVFCAGFCRCVQFGRDEPLVRPGEDVGVGGGGLEAIVLAGDVEGEVDEGLGSGGDEGGESAAIVLGRLSVAMVGYVRSVICPF